MRYSQVWVITLLTAITFELGLIVIKLPTPQVQAEVAATVPPAVPAPSLEDPHETLKKQVAALQQQMARVLQNEEKVLVRVNDDSKRLLMTCVHLNHVFQSVNGAHPGHSAEPPRGDIEACTAKGWRAGDWYNFDIPFGP